MKKLICATAIACSANLAMADTSPWTYFGKIGQAFSSGATTIVHGNYVGGDSWSIEAGNGNAYAFGAAYAVTPDIDLSLSVGFEKTSTSATNGEFAFTRYPVELMVFKNAGLNWRLGGGVRRASDPKLEASGIVAGLSESYQPGTGAVVEVQYLTDRGGNPYGRFGASLRYVYERYEGSPSSNFVNTQNTFYGNHVGLSLIYLY